MCIALQKTGYKVIAVSRSKGPLDELKSKVPDIETIELDLSDWKKTKEVLGKLKEPLDGLVNNAGIAIIKVKFKP